MAKNDKAAVRRAYIRRLENPYASLEIPEDDFEVVQASDLSDKERLYRLRGNPYAKLAMEEGGEEDAVSTPIVRQPVTPAPQSLSKKDFESRCRRIFGLYIPPLEKGRLRPHHRRFIERNGTRSPTARARLVRELEKYDLSSLHGVKAYFNRERDVFTEAKLQQIERLVKGD